MQKGQIFVFLAFVLSAAPVGARPPDIGPLPPVEFKVPKPERTVLKNGVVVTLREDHELPLLKMKIRVRASPADEPADLPHAMYFFGVVWRSGGTPSNPPSVLNEKLERMAAEIESRAQEEYVELSLSCLSKDTTAVLPLFIDLLFHPAFDAKQLSLAKVQALEELSRKNETIGKIMSRVFRDVVYGPAHYYARDASPEEVRRVARAHLLALHKRMVVPETAFLLISGDFDRTALLREIERNFESWKPTGRTPPTFDYAVRAGAAPGTTYVAKEATQSRVRIGRVGFARHDPDELPMQLANYILGGAGTSRLFAQIRSRLGLAYVVGSFFSSPRGPGTVHVGMQTKAGSTIAATRALLSELDAFVAAPARAEEISFAKEAMANSFVFGFDTNEDVVEQQAGLEFFGFPPDHNETYLRRLRAVTPGQIWKVSRTYFSRDRMKIVVVGDASKFEAPLSTLGLPVTEIPLETID